MHAVHTLIENNVVVAWLVLAGSFVVLAKCADIFVDSAVSLATRLNVPKLVIGIVLVSLATTAPELSVSLIAALSGNPEMALGNAIGSVICDDGLALGLAGLVSTVPIVVIPTVLRTSGLFLVVIEVLVFLFVIFDHTLNRIEGLVLVTLFAGYLAFMFRQHKRGDYAEALPSAEVEPIPQANALKLAAMFVLALGGIIFSSELIVSSATSIARACRIPESVIALTLVAFGTSIPEVATCVTAAYKKHGDIAVGNILGADILNICWVAGASSIANDLVLGRKEIVFMFPSMFIVVGAMLLLLRAGYNLTRPKGMLLLLLYGIYIGSFFVFFGPQ